MNIRKFHFAVLAIAFGGAVGSASAQQAGLAAGVSSAPTPVEAKAAVDIQGNRALTSETALAGTPIQGKPGTQSGVAVTDTTSMGASAAWRPLATSPSFASLSRTQLRELQRYSALR
jgi:hypothetical protein